MFNAGNFIELFVASYMIILLCASLNVSSLNFANWLEAIQSIVSLLVFVLFLGFPLFLLRFYQRNIQKIKDDVVEEFDLKFEKFWEDSRTDSWEAMMWNPIHMSLKILYVLNILVFQDSPQI